MSLAALLFLCAAQPAPAGDWLEVTARVVLPEGAHDVDVGAPFEVKIEARHPAGGIALLPESLPFPESLAERRAARTHERSGDAKMETDRYTLQVLAFEPGDVEIPPIPLAFGSTRADTPRLTVVVSSALPEEARPVASSTRAEAIAELEKMAAQNPEPRELTIPDYRPLLAAAVIAVLAAAALIARALVLRARRRALEQPPPPPPPPRPAHEVALERLEAIKRAGYLAKGDHKTFYVEVSEVLRAYAGARWGFESVELTLAELMAELREKRTPGLDLARYEQLLREADLVKFAKYVPTDAEAHALLNGAFEVVERTQPAPAPGEGPAREEARP